MENNVLKDESKNLLRNFDLDEFKKEKLAEMFSNEEFINDLLSHGMNVNDIKNNVVDLIDYYNDFLVQQDDPNFKRKFKNKLVFKDGKVSFEYGLNEENRSVYLVRDLSPICDIPEEYLFCKSSDIGRFSQRLKFIKSMSLTLKADKFNSFNYFIQAKKKSGGTYITSILYKELLVKFRCDGSYVDFYSAYSKLNELLFDKKPESKQLFNKMMDTLINVDILVLNKISSVSINTYSRDNILFTIIDQRVSKGKSTIITSEVSFEDFILLLKDKKNSADPKLNMLIELFKDNYEFHNISLNLSPFK